MFFLNVILKIFYSVFFFFLLKNNYVLRKMNQITCSIIHNTLFNIIFHYTKQKKNNNPQFNIFILYNFNIKNANTFCTHYTILVKW